MATITKMAASLDGVIVKAPPNDENCEVMETDGALEEGELSDGIAEAPEEPSKRFQLVGDVDLAVPKVELDELYGSLGIDEENERHYRFNGLHIRGLESMRTRDVFEYFSGLKPVSVRWLGEGVCNAVWDDEIKPARALLYLSAEINDWDVATGCYQEDLPAGRWRRGVKCEKSDRIIMRYVGKDDRLTKPRKRTKHKEIHVAEEPKNPWGEIAQTWGQNEGVERQIWTNAPVRNLPDLRTSLNDIVESRFTDIYLQRATELRRERPPSPPLFLRSSSESDESDTEFVRRRKLPKMHADREEERVKLARMEAAIKAGDLRSRLNRKKQNPPRVFHKDPAPSDESDLSTDWASENYGDLRRTLVNKQTNDDNLETDSDLELSDGEMLQIEVDNEYYRKRSRKE